MDNRNSRHTLGDIQNRDHLDTRRYMCIVRHYIVHLDHMDSDYMDHLELVHGLECFRYGKLVNLRFKTVSIAKAYVEVVSDNNSGMDHLCSLLDKNM